MSDPADLDPATKSDNPIHFENFEIELQPPDVVKPRDQDEKEEPFFFTWEDFVNRNFYISGPWAIDYYHTVRGCENFHFCLWICKDFAWAQDLHWEAMFFGCGALLWSFILLYHALEARNVLEVYMWITMALWLGGNFVWMAGEVFKDDDEIVVPVTANIFESAIAWALFYYFILKPFKVIKQPDDFEDSAYSRPGLRCRFPFFENWREYEHLHMLCWLGKDLSWNRLSPEAWVICLIPTFLIGIDFIYSTFRTKNQMEDCVHYFAQVIWVIGNMLWALGDMFVEGDHGDDDSAEYIFKITRHSKSNMRWWTSWFSFASLWPIIILYMVWIPMTFMKKFPEERASLTNKPLQKHQDSEA